jgi:hypothetical protein
MLRYLNLHFLGPLGGVLKMLIEGIKKARENEP